MNNPKKNKTNKKMPWTAKAKFILLAIAGTIFFGCEGFDGITTLLGTTSLPFIAIFIIGMVFSLLSIAIFYAFDLLEVSKNLGVDYKSAPKLIDNYLKKVQYIKGISASLRNNILERKTLTDIDNDIELIQLLIRLYNELDTEREALTKALRRPTYAAAKIAISSIAGIIFFSGGFCAGQTVALAIAGLFTTAVVPTFWPILVTSVFVGSMAFAIYWFVQLPSIENLISKWFSLDKEKVDELCDPDSVKKDKIKLADVEKMLLERRKELVKIQEMEQALSTLEIQCISLDKNITDVKSQKSTKFKKENGSFQCSANFDQGTYYLETSHLLPDNNLLTEASNSEDFVSVPNSEPRASSLREAPHYSLFARSNLLIKERVGIEPKLAQSPSHNL